MRERPSNPWQASHMLAFWRPAVMFPNACAPMLKHSKKKDKNNVETFLVEAVGTVIMSDRVRRQKITTPHCARVVSCCGS